MLHFLSVLDFGTAETPGEMSQASSPRTGSPFAAGLQHPLPISHICRMPQLGHLDFISHRENLYVDGLVWLSSSHSVHTRCIHHHDNCVPFCSTVTCFSEFLW